MLGVWPADAAPSSSLVGAYTCALASGEVNYPALACKIIKRKAKDGSGRTLWFEKSAGSQRIRGWVAPQEHGFDVDGEFYCPRGACSEKIQVRFVPLDGGFRGRLEHSQGGTITIDLRRK
ncbi:MAG: hypothetical protein EXR77_13570 [Myxococcales bacterium]|nr:hypothetical protein [Myxococcales bacterium]